MNNEVKVEVERQLIHNPTLAIDCVNGTTFKNPQTYGAFKIQINTRRKYVGFYLKLKGVNPKEIAKEIGVSVYNLNKYVNSKTVKFDVAHLINEYLIRNYSTMYAEVLQAKKQAKIDAITPKEVTFDGANKEQVRDLFVNKVSKSTVKSGKFFVLPSDSCAFEIQTNLQVDNNFHYVACEHNKDVFLKLAQTIAKNNLVMSANLGESSDILNVCKPNTFSHAFLDYCGTFPTYENEVRNLLVNNSVKVNGLIGLTFCCREANTKNQTTIDFHKSVIEEMNCDTVPSVLGGTKIKLLSMLGNSYKLVEYVSYNDGSSMVFALLKRIA